MSKCDKVAKILGFPETQKKMIEDINNEPLQRLIRIRRQILQSQESLRSIKEDLHGIGEDVLSTEEELERALKALPTLNEVDHIIHSRTKQIKKSENKRISPATAVQVAKKDYDVDVTVTTIAKWCKKYNIGHKPAGVWLVNERLLRLYLEGRLGEE